MGNNEPLSHSKKEQMKNIGCFFRGKYKRNLTLFPENLVPHVYDDEREDGISDLIAVFSDSVDHARSDEVPDCDEDAAPECRAEKSNRDEWQYRHLEDTRRNRDEVSHDGDEPPDECVDVTVFEKKVFGLFVFFLGDEDVSSVFL